LGDYVFEKENMIMGFEANDYLEDRPQILKYIKNLDYYNAM
jgi:hypothetical protein